MEILLKIAITRTSHDQFICSCERSHFSQFPAHSTRKGAVANLAPSALTVAWIMQSQFQSDTVKSFARLKISRFSRRVFSRHDEGLAPCLYWRLFKKGPFETSELPLTTEEEGFADGRCGNDYSDCRRAMQYWPLQDNTWARSKFRR